MNGTGLTVCCSNTQGCCAGVAGIPVCCATPDCHLICINAMQGYFDGVPASSVQCPVSKTNPTPPGSTGICGGTIAGGNCSEHGIVNGCCCIPCTEKIYPPDVFPTTESNIRCLCENGTLDQIKCAANNHTQACCPDVAHSTNVYVPDPVVNCISLNPARPNACGSTYAFNPTCDPIEIQVCRERGTGRCPDLCTILDHEYIHYSNCKIDGYKFPTSCDGYEEHVRVAWGAYQGCSMSLCPLDCSANIQHLQNFCTEYCTNNCPFNSEVEQICDMTKDIPSVGIPYGCKCFGYPGLDPPAEPKDITPAHCSFIGCSFDSDGNGSSTDKNYPWCVNCNPSTIPLKQRCKDDSQCNSGTYCGLFPPAGGYGCCIPVPVPTPVWR